MKWTSKFGIPVLGTGLACAVLTAQEPALPKANPAPQGSPSVAPGDVAPPYLQTTLGPVPLDWTPPALAELNTEAAMKTSFTLDRNLLRMAAGLVPDSEEQDRQVINKLDGVSVHLLRFSDAGVPDEGAVDAIRAAYHLRGWKHLVTTTNAGGPLHSGTTDVWLVLDGVNIRGAVVLAETPRSLTLVSVAGNLSPVDLLHLRGHFGIPRFDGEQLEKQ